MSSTTNHAQRLRNLQQRRLYQKGAYVKQTCLFAVNEEKTPQLADKHIPDQKDEMLRLHQSLALVCARASGDTGPADPKKKYVISTEVVACNIQIMPAAAPSSSSSSSSHQQPVKPRPPAPSTTSCSHQPPAATPRTAQVWLCKNTTWEGKDRIYVEHLLTSLKDIGSKFTKDTIKSDNSTDMREKLVSLIYEYCKKKVWSRLGKLILEFEDVEKALQAPDKPKKRSPEEMRKSKEALQLLLKPKLVLQQCLNDSYDRLKTSEFGKWRLAFASYYCWKNPPPPHLFLVKKWDKLASYTRAFNNLVTWAVKAGQYADASYNKVFLNPDNIRYSTPHDPPILMHAFQTKTLKDHYDPKYQMSDEAEEDSHKRQQLLNQAIIRSGDKGVDHAEKIFIHAEMHMAPLLAHDNPDKMKRYIGISKPCCFLCFNALKSLEGKDKIFMVKGTHNKLYHKWMIPPLMREDEVSYLEKQLDKVITKQVRKHKTYQPTADSICNSENTSDLHLQPREPKDGKYK